MLEKRTSPRLKLRLVVDFNAADSKTSGITYDVSRAGIFVRTIRIPNVGRILSLVLHLPDGKQVPVQGKVVRSFNAPGTLRLVVPSGFGLRVSGASQEYEEFVSSLLEPGPLPAAKA